MINELNNNDLDKVRNKFKKIIDVDFHSYKSDFFKRCLKKRMQELGFYCVDDYISYIDDNRDEVDNFTQELSVYHSQFFRDPNKYEVLKNYVLPDIIQKNINRHSFAFGTYENDKKNKDYRYTLRIWSAGCAGGEEPYSIAMIVNEVLNEDIKKWQVQIFGTDINQTLLEKAKIGLYAQEEFSKKRFDTYYLQRYFTQEGNYYRIDDKIKNMVHFSKLNLLTTQPFGALDIIFCRNVLIYFEHSATKLILNKFYDNMNANGYLFLGNAEIIDDSFFCYFKKIKMYGEFIYKKIVKGSPEYEELVKKQIDIKAGLGIKE